MTHTVVYNVKTIFHHYYYKIMQFLYDFFLRYFDIPMSVLPTVKSSSEIYGKMVSFLMFRLHSENFLNVRADSRYG